MTGTQKNDNGPLNNLFQSTIVDITDPNGLVTKVKSSHLAIDATPEKTEARENLERARAALKEAEEKYRQVSRDTDRKILKTLNDYYAGMYVLEYDRHPMMVGDGPVMKENFTITRIDKVTMVGNGFIQVKGKSVRYKTRDKFGIPHENTTKLEITTETGTNLHITRVDRILDENQLDKVLDRVRKHFFKQMGSIW